MSGGGIISRLWQIGDKKALTLIKKYLGGDDLQLSYMTANAVIQYPKLRKDFVWIKRMFESKSPNARQMSMGYLLQINSDKVLPLFESALSDDNYLMRYYAISYLWQMRGECFLLEIEEKLNDPNASVRSAAMKIVFQKNKQFSLEFFKRQFKYKRDDVRPYLLQALRKMEAKKSEAFLIEMYASKNGTVRGNALSFLYEYKGNAFLNALKDALKDKSAYVRGIASGIVFQRTSAGNDLAFLEKSMGSRYADVRRVVMIRLQNCSGSKVLAIIGKAGLDNDSMVRSRALNTLVQIGINSAAHNKAVLVIGSLIKSKNATVRLDAVSALTKIKSNCVTGQISKFIIDPAKDVRFQAIMSLEHIGNKVALQGLISGIKSKKIDDNTRKFILKAIANLKGIEALPELKKNLKHKNPDVRCYAIYAIGKIGGKEAHTLIDDGLLDDVSSVRESALDAFAEYKDTKTRDILINHYYREVQKKLREKTIKILKKNFAEDKKVLAFIKEFG